MKKADRIAEFIEQLGASSESAESPFYAGYFRCFSDGKYYEAHDVLEHLWLRDPGDNYAYYKGLIQIAGAFVHLQKQFLRPHHPKDGARLRPAVRLFRLGLANLDTYRPAHMQFDVESLCFLAQRHLAEIVSSEFTRNPWSPDHLPQIAMTSGRTSPD